MKSKDTMKTKFTKAQLLQIISGYEEVLWNDLQREKEFVKNFPSAAANDWSDQKRSEWSVMYDLKNLVIGKRDQARGFRAASVK